MIAAYLCSAGERAYSLDSLSAQEFGFTKIPYESLVGEGKNKIDLIDAPLEKLMQYSCEDADYTYRLYKLYSKKLEEQGLDELSAHIEMPYRCSHKWSALYYMIQNYELDRSR
jgi:DNA polymerase-1